MKKHSKERMVHQYMILEEKVHTLIYLCQTLNILVPAAIRQAEQPYVSTSFGEDFEGNEPLSNFQKLPLIQPN